MIDTEFPEAEVDSGPPWAPAGAVADARARLEANRYTDSIIGWNARESDEAIVRSGTKR